MQEALFQYIWKYQQFDKKNLTTTQGLGLSVVKPGLYNLHDGPDFLQASIALNNLTWHGGIEIHRKSSDWLKHKHQHDTLYNNVILHVVWEADTEINRPDGSLLPTLELKNYVNHNLLDHYQNLIENKANGSIPCHNYFDQIDNMAKASMLEKALTNRLQRKSREVEEILKKNMFNWEETCYQMLGKNFGFKANADSFKQLTEITPLNILKKHRDSLPQIEAILFGQAGFLTDELQHNYATYLKDEYEFLACKYGLKTHLTKNYWVFKSLRPPNFPTIRLAQFARLIYEIPNLYSFFVETPPNDIFKNLTITDTGYWEKHYYLDGAETQKRTRGLSKASVENIIINTVCPILVCYSRINDQPYVMQKAFLMIEQLKAENNRITRIWENLGLSIKTAYESQAVIEQYNFFCKRSACLSCPVGHKYLKIIA